MTDVRQRLLVLHLARPDLVSSVAAWAWYDGTGKERHSSGDSGSPPYESVVHAMQVGRRVGSGTFSDIFSARMGERRVAVKVKLRRLRRAAANTHTHTHTLGGQV